MVIERWEEERIAMFLDYYLIVASLSRTPDYSTVVHLKLD
jgi:hypothetical protein